MSGRIRSIKPELLEDAVTAGLTDMAFRLFIGVMLLSDDYGRFRAEPGWLIGQIYWKRSVQVEPFLSAMKELETKAPKTDGDEAPSGPLVHFYVVRGQRYGEVRNWSKHQKVDKPGKPRVPAPSTEPEDSSHEDRAPVSRDSREGLAPDLDHGLGSGLGLGPTTEGPEPERAVAQPSKPTRGRPKGTGTTIPETWVVSDGLHAWAKGKGIARRDVDRIAERFRDYWLSADPAVNRNAIKRDWDAAFRTWVGNGIQRGEVIPLPVTPPKPAPPPEPSPERRELVNSQRLLTEAAVAAMQANKPTQETA